MISLYSVEVAGRYKGERDFEDHCSPGRCSGSLERQVGAHPYVTTWERAFMSTHVGSMRLAFWISTGNWDLNSISSVPHVGFINGKVCKLVGAKFDNNTAVVEPPLDGF